jgi:phosphatidylinositol-4,5-bisphosphate 3-kinase catalytic subunit alpha/beta/delta
LLELYLILSGKSSHGFYNQIDLVNTLCKISHTVRNAKQHVRDQVLREELEKIVIPPLTTIPIFPAICVEKLIVDRCKWLDSFTVPLWLVFKNSEAGAPPVYVIFKSGDDLRQDALTLQMFTIMDELWKVIGIDLQMTPYRILTTGKNSGMIEVVLNAETTANIQKMAGGVAAAFSNKPLSNWLLEHNSNPVQYQRCVDNFMRSLAGYCVATYVLGIGDRHNDNIMVTKTGHLFHIDFAHFLGNVMKFGGIKRDRAPFVLTPEFVHVIGGRDSPGWEQFVKYCVNAFNVVRRHSYIFISLFMLVRNIFELIF